MATNPTPPQLQPTIVYAPKTNGLAVCSLVFSILWIFWVGSAIGFLLGVTALSQIDSANPRFNKGGRGLAIAGVCISAVSFLPIVLILVSAAGR